MGDPLVSCVLVDFDGKRLEVSFWAAANVRNSVRGRGPVKTFDTHL